MTFSRLQRRAFVLALILMAGALTIVLCYWQGVERGVVPSPMQSMVAAAPISHAQPAAVSAREPVSTPTQAETAAPTSARRAPPPKPAEPVSVAVSAPEPVPADVGSVGFTAPVPHPAEIPSPTSASTNQTPPSPLRSREVTLPPNPPAEPVQSVRLSAEDKALAEHWLSDTNKRPVVRVRYKPGEILRLVEMRRGAIVVRGKGKVRERELYLQSKPGTPPLFLPYTKTVADRFSNYSLILESSPELAPLTSTLSVYFLDSTVALTFVPDHPLATEIFGQVAKANRSVSSEFSLAEQMIFEGQLTLEGAEPNFEVLEVRSGAKRLAWSEQKADRPPP